MGVKYDYKIEKMPEYRWPWDDRNDPTLRIWQVRMIERNEMGEIIKEFEVERANLTYDEAGSAWNELRQRLFKSERGQADRSKQTSAERTD